MGLVEELGAAVAQASSLAAGAVVGLGPRWVLGSGVVIEAGKVLTNAHNLPGEEVTVRFAGGRRDIGTLVAADVDGDLAVIAVDTSDVSPVRWPAEPPAVVVGSPVVALAAREGGGHRATVGFVSATERAFRGPRGRRITGALEHTAPMARGSSGGPLVDVEGRLVGVNTHRLGEGFYLAQPASAKLRERVAALGRGEAPSRPRLGLMLAADGSARRLRAAVGLSERDGVLVHAVEEGGPADSAGVRKGDLLVAAGDRPLARADDLLETLESVQGGTLRLGVVRGDDETEVVVTLGEAES